MPLLSTLSRCGLMSRQRLTAQRHAPAELPAVLVIMDLAEHVRLHIAYHDPCEARAARACW